MEPTAPMLARAVDRLPPRDALPGGCWYEPKWDGFRATARVGGAAATLWSRNGADLTDRFPEITGALVDQLGELVVDGELVIWGGERLDFVALQQRMTTSRRRIADAVAQQPASFVLFDLIGERGDDLRDHGYRDRRDRLERHGGGLAPPLMLTPATDDPEEAMGWFHRYAPAGVEGLVAKGADQRYVPGARGWLKYRYRHTTEAIVGAVDGTIDAPSRLVLGAWNERGELRVVGATAVLSGVAARRAASHLRPADPGHPWPTTLPAQLLGGLAGQRRPSEVELVEPVTVAEVSADTAFDRGRWRHPVRFHRIRADVDPGTVTTRSIARPGQV